MGDAPDELDSGALTDALKKVQNDEVPFEESVLSIIDMGFSREEALKALKHSNNDVARAIEYIFNHSPELTGTNESDVRHVEDADIARAMANSLGNEESSNGIQYGPQQPSPNTPPRGNRLTPTVKGYYQSSQWGMVSLGGEGNNLARLREIGEPTLLVPAVEAPYIAPLMVILHKIPLARLALLQGSKDVVQDYGYDSNWWNGSSIEMEDGDGHPIPSNTIKRFAIEAQRVMAFLDGQSRRPYADIRNFVLNSASSVIPALSSEASDDNSIGSMFTALAAFWGQSSRFSKAFQTEVKVIQDGEEEDDDDERPTVFSNLICDATVAMASSLYDMIDDMVWPPPQVPANYLNEIADILHLTIKRDDGESGAGVSIPLVWYPARYSAEITRYVREIREMRDSMRKEVLLKTKERGEFAVFGVNDGSKLLKNTLDYLQSTADSDITNTALSGAVKDLSSIQDNYERRKREIDVSIEDILRDSKDMANLFNGPVDPETFQKYFPGQTQKEMGPYFLRGVIISPTEYCFYSDEEFDKSSESLLIEMDDVEQSGNGSWWKVVQTETGEPSAQPVSEHEVLDWAKSGSSIYKWQEVTLVYANETANSKKQLADLPPALSQFVESDKKELEREIQRQDSSKTFIEVREVDMDVDDQE